MLSGETAAGQYPVEAVQTMFNIATRTEESLNYKEILSKRRDQVGMTITDAIKSVAHTAINLSAAAIVTPTESHTARMIAKYRPQAPIVAVTVNESVSRKLYLYSVYSRQARILPMKCLKTRFKNHLTAAS